MKIVFCLFLITIGIIGLLKEHKRRVKERKEIMLRVVANYIIAKDMLTKLSKTNLMTGSECFEAIEHLTDNSIEIILKACGTSYVEESDWLMKDSDLPSDINPRWEDEEPIEVNVNITKASDDVVTIPKERYEQLLQYEQERKQRQSMINSFMQNK